MRVVKKNQQFLLSERAFISVYTRILYLLFFYETIETPSSPRGSEIASPWECLPEEIRVGKGERRYTFHGNLPTINACTLRVENMVVFIHNYKSELIVITFLREAFISKLYFVEVARQIWRIFFLCGYIILYPYLCERSHDFPKFDLRHMYVIINDSLDG